MSMLGALRQSARALLPGDCFLRRDQQLRALFVTDFPRRHADIKEKVLENLQQNGFSVAEDKGLWRLDLNEAALRRFIASLPAPGIRSDLPLEAASLCRSLMAQGVVPASAQPWEPVRRALLRLDAGERLLLYPELRAICAQYKRKKTPLPTAIVSLLNAQEENIC